MSVFKREELKGQLLIFALEVVGLGDESYEINRLCAAAFSRRNDGDAGM